MQFIQHLTARVSARAATCAKTAAALAVLSMALPARAHICMEAPMSRVGPTCTSASAQKPGPCGINTRSTKYVTECRPGQTLTVTLNETINHDSHYRIAFNPNGATFEDPKGIDDKDGKHPFVLLDGIKDESAARQSVKVTLPEMACEQCTLQLIQVMYDKTGNGFGTDDIYYACADIVLKGTPASGECGVSSDAGIVAPKPVLDAGAAQDPIPVPASDAGASTDAGSPSTEVDAATGGSAGDAGTNGGQDAGDAEDEDADSGGCTIATHRTNDGVTAVGVLLALAALIHRRRLRG